MDDNANNVARAIAVALEWNSTPDAREAALNYIESVRYSLAPSLEIFLLSLRASFVALNRLCFLLRLLTFVNYFECIMFF